MSTYRYISTLPLDALRSVTNSADTNGERQRPRFGRQEESLGRDSGATLESKIGMPLGQTGSIISTHEKLYAENRRLRRCLSLYLENSQLKTMNVISTAMSICDDKLGNFISEKILSVDPPVKAFTGDETQTYSRHTNERMPSPSYGKSFPKLDLCDLRNSTSRTSSNSSTKEKANSSFSIRPPMKFGYGPSPYRKSSPKYLTSQTSSDQTDRSAEILSHSKRRSQTLSPSKNRNTVTFNEEETDTQTIDPAGTYNPQRSSSKRPMSAPVSPRYYDAQNLNQGDSYGSTFPAVKSVRHCSTCGINLLPMCICRSPRAADGTVYSTGADKTVKYINDMAPLTDVKHGTPTGRIYDPAKYSPNNSFSANQTDSLYNPQNHPSDIKRHVSKSVSFTKRDDENDLIHDDLSIDDLQATVDIGGTSVDTDSQDLRPSPYQQIKFKHGLQNMTPSGTRTKWQEDNYEKIGVPVASSTPLPSPVDKHPAFRDHTVNGATRDNSAGFSSQFFENSLQDDIEDLLHNKTFLVSDKSIGASRLSSGLLADLIGFTGKGSRMKANYVLHRPLDILIRYYPHISEEVSLCLKLSKPNKRIVGEIAFQLDRQILEYVFAKTNNNINKRRSRYYGYSVASIMLLIDKEVRQAGSDPEIERTLMMRLELILESLFRFGYELERFSEFTQDMVNKYGLLNGEPDPDSIEGRGLKEPAILRIVLAQLLKDTGELDDMLIILDCLHYMAHKNKGPLFKW